MPPKPCSSLGITTLHKNKDLTASHESNSMGRALGSVEVDGNPAVAPDGSDMAKLRAAIGGNHLPALPGKDAGENDRSARRKMRRKLRRHADQRPGENVGDDEIEGTVLGKGR